MAKRPTFRRSAKDGTPSDFVTRVRLRKGWRPAVASNQEWGEGVARMGAQVEATFGRVEFASERRRRADEFAQAVAHQTAL
jgi:hypothetical protein